MKRMKFDKATRVALRAEQAEALGAGEVVPRFLKPAKAIKSEMTLVTALSASGLLTEAALSKLFAELLRQKDRETTFRYANDDALGYACLRKLWLNQWRFIESDPTLSLKEIVSDYKGSRRNSVGRLRWYQLIVGQSYRERDWGFLEHWIRVATDAELASVGDQYMYGAIVGLANSGKGELAEHILERLAPNFTPAQELFYAVPLWRLGKLDAARVTNDALMSKLHSAGPLEDPVWNWFCQTYRERMSEITQNFMDIRTNPDQAAGLQQVILSAVEQKRPLSFQRLGDGGSYRMKPPSIASGLEDMYAEDDRRRESVWWNTAISEEFGEKIAHLVAEALKGADILGVCSAHRLIRDARFSKDMLGNYAGRAFLAHVEAMGTVFSMKDGIRTEERAHTILYTDEFLAKLVEAAERVVVVGGLSPEQMALCDAKQAEFIALTPQQNMSLPTAENARWIVEDYDSIAADLVGMCSPGTLVLLSGGYAGKALAHLAKTHGAVALDIGSRADTLFGRQTRSPADAI